MASWGSFAWGFFVGMFVGDVTLVFFLAIVRHRDTEPVAEYSPPLAAEHETLALAASNSEVPKQLA